MYYCIVRGKFIIVTELIEFELLSAKTKQTVIPYNLNCLKNITYRFWVSKRKFRHLIGITRAVSRADNQWRSGPAFSSRPHRHFFGWWPSTARCRWSKTLGPVKKKKKTIALAQSRSNKPPFGEIGDHCFVLLFEYFLRVVYVFVFRILRTRLFDCSFRFRPSLEIFAADSYYSALDPQ